jgi:hypothetical protein
MISKELRSQSIASLKAGTAQLDQTRVLVGFDGFVDTILHVVKKRHSASRYDRLERMAEFGERIQEAAGLSANMEMVTQMQKLGGNGPIMAHALGASGTAVTYIGNLGYPSLHPVFSDFAKTAEVHSLAEPGYTDAIEFDDGKLMFGKHESLREVNWKNLLKHLPEKQLLGIFSRSHFIALVNWTMLTQMREMFQKILSSIAPKLKGPKRILFFDLADPAKRSSEDIAGALRQISRFQKFFRVVLGLNFRESVQVGEVLGVRVPEETHEGVRTHAVRLQELLRVDTVVIHPTHFAAAANATGSACVEGPFTPKPKITTGAGDHFNAGFGVGCILGLDLAQSLQIGVATSGFYVRNARSPSVADLIKFLKTL